MTDVLIFLAPGFEEVEALTVADLCRRADLSVDLVAVGDDLDVVGAHDICVRADHLLADIDSADYRAYVIPGGLPGATNLRDNAEVIEIVQQADAADKVIAAICAGPIVLGKAGVSAGKQGTSFPGFGEASGFAEYSEDLVVEDGNVISSRGPSTAMLMAVRLVQRLAGLEQAEALAEGLLLDTTIPGLADYDVIRQD